MSLAPSLLSLEKNLALLAGAGAGKTYNLVTLCLHLLSGSRGAPLRTSQLCLLTFTDKAATELKDRLRARLDGLSRGEVPDPALGLPSQPPEFWRRVRDDLGAALIGTFHSLCIQLLRRAPAGFGVDPAFSLLDERTGAQLIEDCAERLVVDALDEDNPPVVELCRELNFTAQGRGRGLVTYLCEVYGKLREEGLEAEMLRVSDEVLARADFDAHLIEAKRLLSAARDADRQGKRSFAETLARVASAFETLTFERFQSDWPRLERALEQEPGLMRLKDDRKELAVHLLGQPKEGRFGLRDKYAGCLIAPFERAFVGLLGGLKQRHREALARRGALDFAELVVLTRDLLRDHVSVRREVQERIRALLVDEFQDTNRLQLELVTLLSERREGAPRSDTRELPLEPGFLCAVGDRKQSIYEFRGADVSVFEKLALRIESEGGARGHLQQNWRSSPLMLAFFNELFALVMRPSVTPRDYEVAYAAEGDDLRPVRPNLRPSACVDRLVYAPNETAELCRAQDADGVARWIRSVLVPEAQPCVVDQGQLRRAGGGDVAILFRRFSFLEVYRQALTRMGVPHRVIRGRGFYGAQEVLDLAALLSLVVDPTDNVAFAAVLRSPLVGISDASLFRISLAGGDRLSLAAAQRPGALEDFDFPQDEAERVSRLLRLYPRLRKERDRLGIRPLLQVALAETDLRVSLAGTPYGEQALANVDKLLDLAARWD
ncbi:MAG: UvrD-helicase domain-containing protein, partial [Myxococcaceae bacterium]